MRSLPVASVPAAAAATLLLWRFFYFFFYQLNFMAHNHLAVS